MAVLVYRDLVNRDLPIRERACVSKAAFVSRAEARQLVRDGRYVDAAMKPYHCRFCSMWHLGHSRRRAGSGRRAGERPTHRSPA